MPDGSCPFCALDGLDRVFYRDDVIAALWDGYAISPGHALIVPRRHVAGWFDTTHEEQAAMLRGLDIARAAVLAKHTPDGFNIGINVGAAAGQTVFHLHVHLIPRYAGDVPDPRGGVRNVIPSKGNYFAHPEHVHEHLPNMIPRVRPLVRGGSDAILDYLRDCFDRAKRVDIAVAFAFRTGLNLIQSQLEGFLERGGKLRFLTGDYLGGTEPEALEELLRLEGDIELRAFESAGSSFHPKSYIFHGPNGRGIAYVGSSNLTQTALHGGLEWNYELEAVRDAIGFLDVARGFDELFGHKRTRLVDEAWIACYRERRKAVLQPIPELADEPPATIPEPHEIQREALAALEATRKAGNRAGLVVLATGLGKTWLSAFDSNRIEYRRVLFVAHREEILNQARDTFRRIRPDDTTGLYTGNERSLRADVVFASIQTLGRQHHLDRFARDHFDYIVVDEFHHAAAKTYRRLIDHFTPNFLLGLTATPERTDGGDLLALCGENRVFRCDMWKGIEAGRLAPFKYFGVADDVDFSNIPWRNARFDEAVLTTKLATKARAQNALEQYLKHRGTRTLAFCCSMRHADFMAEFFSGAGIRCVAVHSGEASAPRAKSLRALETAELEVVFAVDMFNEGLDVPAIDTVLMLRPTESRIIWLQQFGRGLRTAPEKPHVTVIDYIGNHRVFLNNVRSLFDLPPGTTRAAKVLSDYELRRLSLPPGCDVTYDLQAIANLRAQLPSPTIGGQALVDFYSDFLERNGERPRAVEAYHEGLNPGSARDTHGSWFDFVDSMGGLSPEQHAAAARSRDFLRHLESTPMSRSFKMLVLQAMLAREALPGEIAINDLVDEFAAVAAKSQRLRADVAAPLEANPPSNRTKLKRYVIDNPVNAWAGGKAAGGDAYFAFTGDVFRTTARVGSADPTTLRELVRELVDWRLAAYLDRRGGEIVCKVSHTGRTPMIFLGRKTYPQTPTGWTKLLVEGDTFEGNFVKIALNVIRRPGETKNVLLELICRMFGENAGASGTTHFVSLIPVGDGSFRMERLTGVDLGNSSRISISSRPSSGSRRKGRKDSPSSTEQG